MNIDLLNILLVILVLILPLSVILFHRKQSNNKIYDIFEKKFNVFPVVNIDLAENKPGVFLIQLDKIYHDNHIINIGIPISIPAGQQQLYTINMNQHYKFYNSYLDKRWDMAIVIANSLRTAWNGDLKGYYDVMILRCNYYKTNPPPANWSGTYYKI